MYWYRYDPIDDADVYEQKREQWMEENGERCDWCGEIITEDYAYRIGEDLVCEECIEGCRHTIY